MTHTPGVGALIASPWASRESLTPYDRELATATARWFFETAAPAPAALVVSALAEVTDAWSGDVIVSAGGSSYVVTVPARSSPLAMIERIVRAGSRRGGAWSWSLDAAGVATIRATVPFELVFAGLAQDLMAFGGIYAGQLAYESDAAVAVVPSLGLGLVGADQVGRSGGVTQAQTVAGVATGLRDPDANGTLRFWGTPSEIEDLAVAISASDTWDIALGADVVRVRIDEVAKDPWGQQPLRSVLVASVVAVTQ